MKAMFDFIRSVIAYVFALISMLLVLVGITGSVMAGIAALISEKICRLVDEDTADEVSEGLNKISKKLID